MWVGSGSTLPYTAAVSYNSATGVGSVSGWSQVRHIPMETLSSLLLASVLAIATLLLLLLFSLLSAPLFTSLLLLRLVLSSSLS